MSDLAIKIENLNKTYRRFASTKWQILSSFGFPILKSKFDDFDALVDINITIKKGERVALVGRNGAGKSTLLKILSDQLSKTSGKIIVDGNIQALTELGIGFHPDFTGLENINHSLLLSGFSKKEIVKKRREIIDFTELSEFIHRPIKEYSAGMYARLAFAVAIEIRCEILVIDEILGAGDAYFTGKCIERMKKIAESGATILFVSHDMSAVQMLCDRAIWVHHGKVVLDGGTLDVSKHYMSAVRDEEEQRLEAKKKSLTKELVGVKNAEKQLLFRFVFPSHNENKVVPFRIKEVFVGSKSQGLKRILLTDEVKKSGRGVIYDPQKMNWGEVKFDKAGNYREVGDFDGLYNHAPFVVNTSGETVDFGKIMFKASSSHPISLEVYNEAIQEYQPILTIIHTSTKSDWQELEFDFSSVDCCGLEHRDDEPGLVSKDNVHYASEMEVYGDRQVEISSFYFFDEEKVSRYTLVTGARAFARIEFKVNAASILNPVAVIAIYTPSGECVCQLISRRDKFEFGEVRGQGYVECDLAPFLLGPGEYIVSVGLFKDIDLSSNIESEAYCIHDRVYPLKILPADNVNIDIGMLNQSASWSKATVS